MENFVASKNITQSGLVKNLTKFVEVSEDKLDYSGGLPRYHREVLLPYRGSNLISSVD